MPDLLSQEDRAWIEKQRPKLVQSEAFLRRLGTIQGTIENEWSQHTGPPWHTFHGPSHSLKVEKMLHCLIPKGTPGLRLKEWFYLLASVWLHDAGMIIKDHEDPKTVRDTHHLRSSDYIKRNRSPLGFDANDCTIVKQICFFHRKKEPISRCTEEIGQVRVQLLAAYLRLADALHLDKSRIDPAEFQRLLALGMPWESRFHWLKSMWIPEITPVPDDLRIDVWVYDTPEKSLTHGLLPQLVKDEIREELDSVRDVLIRGRLAFFLDVNIKSVGIVSGDGLAQLEMILGNVRLENVSSASGVAMTITETVLYLAEANPSLIPDYLKQVTEIHDERPCHTLIQRTLDTVQGILKNPQFTKEEDRIKEFTSTLYRQKAAREAKISELARNAEPFLLDRGSILLFGYSRLVLEALTRLPDSAKGETEIFIAEGRGKTQYNHANEIRYCDGLDYALHAREAGFTQVKIVPDITIGSLMARHLIKKVVFGANGIDREGRFGHTAGHLTIAALARVYNVPVYVLADSDKFGKFEWHSDLERKVQWLTRDQSTLEKLDHNSIGTMNLREDWVEAELITMLITDAGAFPPTRIPDYVWEKARQ